MGQLREELGWPGFHTSLHQHTCYLSVGAHAFVSLKGFISPSLDSVCSHLYSLCCISRQPLERVGALCLQQCWLLPRLAVSSSRQKGDLHGFKDPKQWTAGSAFQVKHQRLLLGPKCSWAPAWSGGNVTPADSAFPLGPASFLVEEGNKGESQGKNQVLLHKP